MKFAQARQLGVSAVERHQVYKGWRNTITVLKVSHGRSGSGEGVGRRAACTPGGEGINGEEPQGDRHFERLLLFRTFQPLDGDRLRIKLASPA